MGIREVWDSTEGKITVLASATILIVLLGFLAVNPVIGSLADGDHRGITLRNCELSSGYSQISDRCDLNYNKPDFRNMGQGGFSGWDVYVHKDGNTNFRVEVGDVDAFGGEEFAPHTLFLANNGYLNQNGEEELQQDGSYENIDIQNEIAWNSDVKSALEAGTSCSVRIQPYSMSEVVYTWNDSREVKTQKYHEDWYSHEPDYRDFRNFFPQPVTLEAGDITIKEHSLWCQFDFKEMMDKGAEHGNMVEFKSDRLEAGGDDSQEGYAKINVNFAMDTDLDGVIDLEDDCPETPGLPVKNGCPNQASKILSVDGPRNVTVGEEAEYDVMVKNPDDDSTTVSWSNGETGDLASYTWNTTGNKTVTVTADDGITEDTEEIMVRVKEKSLLASISEFFGKIWSILTFSG